MRIHPQRSPLPGVIAKTPRAKFSKLSLSQQSNRLQQVGGAFQSMRLLFTLFPVHPARCLQRSSKTTAANGPLAAASWWMPNNVSFISNRVAIGVRRMLRPIAAPALAKRSVSPSGLQRNLFQKVQLRQHLSKKCSKSQQRERTSPQKSRRPSVAAVKFAPPSLMHIPSALGHGKGHICVSMGKT